MIAWIIANWKTVAVAAAIAAVAFTAQDIRGRIDEAVLSAEKAACAAAQEKARKDLEDRLAEASAEVEEGRLAAQERFDDLLLNPPSGSDAEQPVGPTLDDMLRRWRR